MGCWNPVDDVLNGARIVTPINVVSGDGIRFAVPSDVYADGIAPSYYFSHFPVGSVIGRNDSKIPPDLLLNIYKIFFALP